MKDIGMGLVFTTQPGLSGCTLESSESMGHFSKDLSPHLNFLKASQVYLL